MQWTSVSYKFSKEGYAHDELLCRNMDNYLRGGKAAPDHKFGSHGHMPTKDEQLEEIEWYRQAIRNGAIPFPRPLVCINGDVAEGATRYWAWRMEGHKTIEVCQNMQWQEAA